MFADKSSSFSTRKINKRPSFSPNAPPGMKIVPHARTLDPDPDDFWIFCSPSSNDIPGKLCDIEKLGRFHRFAEFRQVLCFEIQAAGFFNASLSCKMQSYREHLFYYEFSCEFRIDSLNKKIL